MDNDLVDQIDSQRHDIHTDQYPMSIGEVVNMYRDGELDVHPEFQREYRWSDTQRTKFIESILLGIPVPSFFVAQQENGVWDVVDGLQRICTILSFMGELKDENGEKIQALKLEKTTYIPALEGVTWEGENQLPIEIKRTFKREKIDFKIVKKESDKDTKYELFQRLNTGGSPLSPQELRNCLFIMIDRDFYYWLNDLVSDINFTSCTPLTERQMEEKYNMELAVRFIVFYHIDLRQSSEIRDVNEFVTDTIRKMIVEKNINKEKYEDIFRKTFEIINKSLNEDAFRKYHPDDKRHKGAFSLALFEAITQGVAKNIDSYEAKSSSDIEEIRNKIQSISAQEVFKKHTGTGIRAGLRLPHIIPFAIDYFKK